MTAALMIQLPVLRVPGCHLAWHLTAKGEPIVPAVPVTMAPGIAELGICLDFISPRLAFSARTRLSVDVAPGGLTTLKIAARAFHPVLRALGLA